MLYNIDVCHSKLMYPGRHWLCYFRICIITHNNNLFNKTSMYSRSKFCPQKTPIENVHFHDSFWREQTLAATKLFLSLTRIDFSALVSSRAVRISSRAVRVPALLLRHVRPSYGTFSLMVFQGNCAQGHTGHMIKTCISWQHQCLSSKEKLCDGLVQI